MSVCVPACMDAPVPLRHPIWPYLYSLGRAIVAGSSWKENCLAQFPPARKFLCAPADSKLAHWDRSASLVLGLWQLRITIKVETLSQHRIFAVQHLMPRQPDWAFHTRHGCQEEGSALVRLEQNCNRERCSQL